MEKEKEKTTEANKKKQKTKRKITRETGKKLTNTQKVTHTHSSDKSEDRHKHSKLAAKPLFKNKKQKANPEPSSAQRNKINMYFSKLGTESERVPGTTGDSAGDSSKFKPNLDLCLTQGQVDKTRDQERPALARTQKKDFSSYLTSPYA